MRSFACFSVAAVVAGSLSAQAAETVSTAGSWTGEMRQIDPTATTSYPMTMVLKGRTGATTYPTLKCTGALSRVAELKGGYTVYQEKAVNEPGATCADGIVTVKVDQGKLVLGWFAAFEGEPTLASAALSREAK